MSMYIPKDPTKHARAKKSKYRNTKCKAAGKKFDSVGERNRWFFLSEAQREGKIRNLRCQVEYSLNVNDIHICNYIADFVYQLDLTKLVQNLTGYKNGIAMSHDVVEDFKGGYRLPPDWPIKQKLMKACHGVDVKIVKEPTAAIG